MPFLSSRTGWKFYLGKRTNKIEHEGTGTCVRIEISQDTDNADQKAKWFLKVHKGLHIIYRGYEAGNIYKKFFKKVLAPSEEHDKKILARMQLLQKKFVPHMLKKFIYLSGKVLLLFETLNFQKEINSKRYTSLNEQSY